MVSRLAGLVLELAGGEVQGGVAAVIPARQEEPEFWKKEIHFSKYFIHDFLGFKRDQDPLS